MKLLAIFAVLVISVLTLIADYFIKISASGDKYLATKPFLIGFALYSATTFGTHFVFKHVKMATVGAFYAVFIILGLCIIGFVSFDEHLNAYEIAGIVMALLSLILLGRFA